MVLSLCCCSHPLTRPHSVRTNYKTRPGPGRPGKHENMKNERINRSSVPDAYARAKIGVKIGVRRRRHRCSVGGWCDSFACCLALFV